MNQQNFIDSRCRRHSRQRKKKLSHKTKAIFKKKMIQTIEVATRKHLGYYWHLPLSSTACRKCYSFFKILLSSALEKKTCFFDAFVIQVYKIININQKFFDFSLCTILFYIIYIYIFLYILSSAFHYCIVTQAGLELKLKLFDKNNETGYSVPGWKNAPPFGVDYFIS